MHEMAIAGCVLEGAVRHAEGRRVTHVQLKVGHLRQVVPSALQFAWQLVTRDTLAEGSSLALEQIAVVGRCRACDAESPQDGFPFRCGRCAGLELEVIRGRELLIDWLEVEQADRDEQNERDNGDPAGQDAHTRAQDAHTRAHERPHAT